MIPPHDCPYIYEGDWHKGKGEDIIIEGDWHQREEDNLKIPPKENGWHQEDEENEVHSMDNWHEGEGED